MSQSLDLFKTNIQENFDLGENAAFRECNGASNSAKFVTDGFLFGIPNLDNLDTQATSLAVVSRIQTSSESEALIGLLVKSSIVDLVERLEEIKSENRKECFTERNQNCALFLGPDGLLYPHNNAKRVTKIDAEIVGQLGPGIEIDRIIIKTVGKKSDTHSILEGLQKLSGEGKIVHSFSEPAENESSITEQSLGSLIDSMSHHTLESGLNVQKGLLTRLLSSLLAKRFVILTGLSGSGKTKLAQSLTTWIAENESYCELVPVGADWTNRDNILGYCDTINNKYQKEAALELILLARKESENAMNENRPARPFFLMLDEMNLSHVERYFSDFLSAIESDKPIPMHSIASDSPDGEFWSGVPNRLKLPENLFVIGTVNVDETTYMFSPKVLDRANVIEFRVNPEEFDKFMENPVPINLEALVDCDEKVSLSRKMTDVLC